MYAPATPVTHPNQRLGAKAIASSPSQANTNSQNASKAHLLDGVQQIKQHFTTLLKKNWSPAEMDDHYDRAMLPVFVAMENKRSPNLGLSLLPSGTDFGHWLNNWQQNSRSGLFGKIGKTKPASARVMFVVPGFSTHMVAADVQRDKHGNTSVLLIEPLGFAGKPKITYEKEALPALQKIVNNNTSKAKIALTVLSLDTQRSLNDCRIFGLSAASKLADSPELLKVLHQQNLAGGFKTAKGNPAKILAQQGQINIVDGKGVLPPAFVKHSQSENVLNEWLKQNPSAYANASINKKGQSLTERFRNNQTVRYSDPVRFKGLSFDYPDAMRSMKERRMGTSIEKKRLTYLDRALSYLAQAPESEIEAFRAHFDRAMTLGTPHSNLYTERRQLGPHPDTLKLNDNGQFT